MTAVQRAMRRVDGKVDRTAGMWGALERRTAAKKKKKKKKKERMVGREHVRCGQITEGRAHGFE